MSKDFWDEIVLPRIKRAVRIVVDASAHTIVDRRPGQWKLFGVDFVLDNNLYPWLVDWNAFPGWDWSYRHIWALRYRRRILGDMWRLVLDTQRGEALKDSYEAPRSAGFELVYHGSN